jgi:hypothetical protein
VEAGGVTRFCVAVWRVVLLTVPAVVGGAATLL